MAGRDLPIFTSFSISNPGSPSFPANSITTTVAAIATTDNENTTITGTTAASRSSFSLRFFLLFTC